MTTSPALSVIVTFYNEASCLEEVCLEALAVLRRDFGDDWELIMVDDGSTDTTPTLIDALVQHYPGLRAIHLHPNSGQSAALEAGFTASQGRLIATLDGDGQNDPADIRFLIEAMQLHQVDMMCGIRAHRADNRVRRISSRIANRVRSSLLRDQISDVGCAIRVFHRRCLNHLCFFRNAHRFFPALVQMQGLRVAETEVRHRPRFSGTSKYGGGIHSRLWVGLADLAGVWWLRRRAFRYHATETKNNRSGTLAHE